MTKQSDVMMSRRTILKTGLAVLAAGTAATASAQKIAQTSVMYVDKSTNGMVCEGCIQFVAPGSCKVVDGKINPKGYCVAFAPKPK